MAANIRRAGSVIRKSFRSRRYASFNSKENIDLSATTSAASIGEHKRQGSERFRARTMSTSVSSSDETEENISTLANPGSPPVHPHPWLRRGSSMTQSMRDAVGTLRQKLRMSTRRGQVHVTRTKVGTRRHTIAGREAQLHSPVKASAQSKSGRTHTKTCLTLETPTRLRREVESLTANMQALNALTPNTLEVRSRTRKSPSTNGRLRTNMTGRKRVTTDIH